MAARIVLTCVELEHLYVHEGLSQANVAAALGCSVATVANRMRRCGIPARDGRFRAHPLPAALLAQLYAEGLPLRLIAAHLGVSVGTVHNWRRAYGIPTRARRARGEAG